MLQDVIHPPDQFPNEALTSNIASQLFDFNDDGFFAESLRNSEVSSSGCSDETHYSTDPALLRCFNYDAGITTQKLDNLSILLDSQAENDTSVHFPATFPVPFLPTHEQFDLSPLQAQIPLTDGGSFVSYSPDETGELAMKNTFMSSNNNHNSNNAQSFVPLNFDSAITAPLPSVFEFEAEEDCLSPLGNYVQGPCLGNSPCSFLERSLSGNAFGQFSPGIMNPVMHATSGSVFPVDISTFPAVPSPETCLLSQELEFQGEKNGSVYNSESVRRVYSAGDIQVLNDNQLINGCSSPLASEMSNLEESTFKIGRYSVEERKERIHRYLKKRNERNFNKKIKYACRKTLADSRPRVRGRFAKNDEFGDIGMRPNYGNHDEEDDNEAVEKEQDEMVDSSDIFAHISGVNSFKSNHHLQSWI